MIVSAVMDVGDGLRSLGLGRYEPLFRASEIDADVLSELMDLDLEKLDVPLAYVRRSVTTPKVTQRFWAVRFRHMRESEAPEYVETALYMFELREDRMEAVL